MSIYSGSDSVAVDPLYASLVVKPYRVQKVEYLHDTDKIHVSGRVMVQGRPEEGVEVINHVGKAITDRNGYFSLTVSRANPSVTLFRRGKECPGAIENILENRVGSPNELYLGRLQCDS